MHISHPTYWPEFYTATIVHWKHILADEQIKFLIIESLQFLVNAGKIELNAFVIMSNHIHLIWQALGDSSPEEIRSSFMKYTARKIKEKLAEISPYLIDELKVNKYDRQYQIWKREALSVELFTQKVFFQKLDYLHENPVRAGLCKYPEDYHYSSARFYCDGIDEFNMLTHYLGK